MNRRRLAASKCHAVTALLIDTVNRTMALRLRLRLRLWERYHVVNRRRSSAAYDRRRWQQWGWRV